MIIVPMTLVSAVTGKASILGSVRIVNDGAGTRTHGNYVYTILGKKGQVLREGTIKNWPRLRMPPLALLQRVMNDAYPTRG